MPTSITEGIRVTVESLYLEEHSEPENQRYTFAYFVRIANESQCRVQLQRRHWTITDGEGKVQTVDGPGVIGEQPFLDPGDEHRYQSGAVLTTPVGTMEGSYEMHEENGRVFDAEIPRFGLQRPGSLH